MQRAMSLNPDEPQTTLTDQIGRLSRSEEHTSELQSP